MHGRSLAGTLRAWPQRRIRCPRVAILSSSWRTLNQLSYNVVSCAGGEQTMRTVERHPGRLDLLITDMIMLGMNGRLLADNVRQLGGALAGGIQDNVGGVRMAASAAVIRFSTKAALSLLNVLARERDKFILQALLNRLGRIGDPNSLPALIGQLRSSYFAVRQAAASSAAA